MSKIQSQVGLNHYQDHFRQYPPVPESTLEPIHRRVNGRAEHAIGARAISLLENHDIIADEQFELQNHRRLAQEHVDNVPAWDAVRYTAKYLEKPYPALRKFINHMDKRADRKSLELEKNGDRVKRELGIVREKIDNSPDELQENLEHFIIDGPSPFISALYEQSRLESEEKGDEPLHPIDWLLEDSENGNERLINFLKYSVDGYEKIQDDPERQRLLFKEKNEWAVGVHRGINEGWLHSDASAISDRMQHLVVRFADYFDLKAQHRGGYAYRGDKYIVLGKKEKDIQHAAKHEMNHALLGSFEHTWIDEATTEHIAQTLNGRRNIEDIREEKHDLGAGLYDNAYRSERDLLAELLAITDGKVKMSDVTVAYSTGEVEDVSAFEALEAKFDSALGVDFSLTLLQIHIKNIQDELIKRKGYHEYAALHEACRIARSDLLQQPDIIFNHPHQEDNVAA